MVFAGHATKEEELMLIGRRIRQLREQREMSQGDIGERTGLQRCYISRVENGHTVPSLETLERFAVALGVPLYQLFDSGDEPPHTRSLKLRKSLEELTGESGEDAVDAQFLLKLRSRLSGLAERDRDVILSLAKKLAAR
jgi:transcriptional regulator with XRE-family HTH domain